jgi:hypothetical protein
LRFPVTSASPRADLETPVSSLPRMLPVSFISHLLSWVSIVRLKDSFPRLYLTSDTFAVPRWLVQVPAKSPESFEVMSSGPVTFPFAGFNGHGPASNGV